MQGQKKLCLDSRGPRQHPPDGARPRDEIATSNCQLANMLGFTRHGEMAQSTEAHRGKLLSEEELSTATPPPSEWGR